MALTGNAEGAQRVCWTETWLLARSWFREKLEALPVQVETDEAGNLWGTLPGDSERAVLIGGHLDSVSNGGWLDGCLNVLAGLEVLRRIAGEGRPKATVRLVDWADEEGFRFGRSLFGSSAVSGSLVPGEFRDLRDAEGASLPDVLATARRRPRSGVGGAAATCERSGVSRAPYRAGPRAGTSRRSAGSCPRHLWRRAPHRQVSRTACPRRRDADGHAPRSCRSGSALSPRGAPHRERGGECHHGRHDLSSRWDRDRGRPRLRAVIRPAQPRRRKAAGDGGGREGCERANRSRGGGGGRMGRAVADPGSAVSP